MTLETQGSAAIIYAARSLPWVRCRSSGFDAEAVHRNFGLAEGLLTVGLQRTGNGPQKPHVPVADVLAFADRPEFENPVFQNR
ncbi:hypothetical protein X742_17255 [Mesorhizobium sp. LNHC232B00]|nr:hypothetical protein X742_17255 [Mesorhizobium sp. LNHC232B00]